ncbi:MAG: fluoride efflux transporter CrcB [Vicinamibacterales bacterium]
MAWIAVAIGGALGSAARHFVNLEVARGTGNAIPWATLVVNVVGCIVIGALAGRTAGGHLHLAPIMRTFLLVGVLGGFTTFSTFELDTFTLGHGGNHVAAFWNIVGQVGLGLGGVWLGYYLAL